MVIYGSLFVNLKTQDSVVAAQMLSSTLLELVIVRTELLQEIVSINPVSFAEDHSDTHLPPNIGFFTD